MHLILLRRDKMLLAVEDSAPELYAFVHSAYSSSSSLFWNGKIIQSSEGVQQGDPLGPLLFCLTIHPMVLKMQSEFCVWYLDDGTLGGTEKEVRHDLEVIHNDGASLGLVLNEQKSEVICVDSAVRESFLHLLNAQVVEPECADLLGSPIGDISSISKALEARIESLRVLGDRLQHFSVHDASLLLRNSLAIPKLLYLLRSSPALLSEILKSYDEMLRSVLGTITNTHLHNTAWSQASLPVKAGGLGIRSAVQLAPSAYLSSTAAFSQLVYNILPPRFSVLEIPFLDKALSVWSNGHDSSAPVGPLFHCQKTWDTCVVTVTANALLENTTDARARARLIAASTRELGAWLEALPISSLGLRMDDTTVRIAVGLRLGTSLCHPHSCQHCGVEVDCLGLHGLSCKSSQGRHHRHAAINHIVHRALMAAQVPSRLEPSGISRSDGKRPDGVTMIPWRSGKMMVWDVTCPDTFAPSYESLAMFEAGAVAARAEEKKKLKYSILDSCYSFTPIAIETSGVIGAESMTVLHEIGHRLQQVTDDNMALPYFLQRLSVAVQRGNAASVMGTTAGDVGLEFFSVP